LPVPPAIDPQPTHPTFKSLTSLLPGCGTYLNSLSAKLPDAACNMACVGDAASSCGGRLVLTLYNRTSMGSSSKKNGAAATLSARGDQWWTTVLLGGLAAAYGGFVMAL
jgi:hypothetical protein